MAHDAAAALTLHPLGRHVVLLAWTGAASPGVRRLQVSISGAPARPPFTQMAVPLEGRAHRNILALRLDRQARTAAIEIGCDGTVLAQAAERSPAAASWEFEAHALVDGVAGADRARLIRFVLEVCGPLFRMSTDAVFVTNARALLAEASAGAGPLVSRCALTADHVFCEGLVPDAIGEQLSAVLLAADGVHGVATRPGLLPPSSPRTGSHGLGLVLPRSAGGAGVRVIVFGENGLVCRTLGPVWRRLPGVHDWLTGSGRNTAPQRRFILDCLAQHRLGAAVSTTLLRELSVLAPVDARPQTRTAAPSGTPELVLDCADGLFIAGRLSDPHRLAETLWIEQGGVERAVSLHTAARFRCDATSSDVVAGAGCGDRDGFALFVPRRSGGATGAPVQLALGLQSGARLDFGHGPTPLDAAEASDAVLALLLREDAPESLLACVEQVSAALLRECGAARPPLHVQDFGVVPSHPAVTLIVPYEADAAMLRCRMGLFATDPLLHGVELLHVAAGPEHAAAAERVLADLEAGYGVPTRLVAIERPAPAGVVLNLAAAASRGTVLCFLGATAVPEATGWLRRLFDVLKARPQRGIVGAQVLYPDHSLVSAGAGIGVDSRGRWSLRPLLAGFPRDYAPAAVPTRVTAVEPDCVLLRRALLQEAGGFGETYHLAASALADLSLHARSRGYEVWRLPEPAVFRMDGPRDADAAARLAARQELDRRTLEQRWREAFDEARGQPVRPATPPQGLPADAPAGAPASGAQTSRPVSLTTQKAA